MKTLLLLFLLSFSLQAAESPKRPNIIFILTDDQGYGDVSAHGNPILKTPNLDRLHRESVRFTDFHVSPTCAPTRSALLTGRHEFRNGVTHTILERERLTLEATTLPQVLQRTGYQTGIFGKWHLGDEAEYQPDKRGFQEVFIHGGGGIGQTYPGSCGDAPGNTYFDPYVLHNGTFEKTSGYCTDVFFEEAIKWMGKVKGGEPFYCHLATNAPHTPLEVKPEDEAPYAGKVPPNVAKFFGMIANIDANIGRLLAKLDEWGIAENTLVIFMSDNGGTQGVKTWNAGLRGAKGSPWLGGTHAVSFWRWPGTFAANERAELTAHLDFFPTLADVSGAKLEEKERRQIEGRSLLPLLKSSASTHETSWPDRTLFTHVGRWEKFQSPATSKFNGCGVRTSRWHLVSVSKTNQPEWQLFDAKADLSEEKNVAEQNPNVVKTLAAEFDHWWDASVPMMVNENVIGPKENPYHVLFRKQFGESK